MNTFIQPMSELGKRHTDVYRGRKSYFQRCISFDGIESGSPPYLSVLPSHSSSGLSGVRVCVCVHARTQVCLGI